MSIAVVFPGQGAQFVGMAKSLYDKEERAKKIIDSADGMVPGLKKVMFEGPEEELQKTDFTQPAILAHSIAAFEVIKEKIAQGVSYYAGHSLGEYAALYAAGSLNFETVVKLVKKRGQLMQEASAKTDSGMAAVIGPSPEQMKQLCESLPNIGYIALANINSPVQTVISGEAKAIEAAEAKAKEIGAKRYIRLRVAGAFHSELMKPAAEGLERELEGADIKEAKVPVVANVSAKAVKSAREIKSSLVKQVVSPVRWVESVEFMRAGGVDTFIEAGPGKVLSGLIKKTGRKLNVFNIGEAEDTGKI